MKSAVTWVVMSVELTVALKAVPRAEQSVVKLGLMLVVMRVVMSVELTVA